MKLSSLHSGLTRLRRFRASVRIGSAMSMFVCVALWILLGAFVLDVLAHMGPIERGIVLAFFIGMLIWALRRWVAPALAVREDEVELALMVERQQGIGTDLVAALQFADGARAQFGSDVLRQAVIDYTDEVSGTLNYLEGFSRQQLVRRASLLIGTVLVAATLTIAFPAYAAAFVNRFLLGNAHYPTNTIIESIDQPGERVAYGQAVPFKVRVSGERPARGHAEIVAKVSGLRTTVDLLPDPNQPTHYLGTLPRALDDMVYTVHLGDDYSDERTIALIPPPVVEVTMQIEVPAYARAKFEAKTDGRQRIALEGSRIVPVVTCQNKSLKSAGIAIDGQKPTAMRPDGNRFVLDAADSPLARVARDVRYEIDVVDGDGLSLERPVTGVVQVRSDSPPRVLAGTVTRYVLAEGEPLIRFRASDDYALETILIRKAVVRADATTQQGSVSSDGGAAGAVVEAKETVETLVHIGGRSDERVDKIRVNLASLKLALGDRVEVTIEAIDFRGDQPGKSARSERMVFQVTDRKGILDGQRELDAQLDKKLDQIIDAQLGGGGSK